MELCGQATHLFNNIINPELLIGSLLRTGSQETIRDKVC